MWLLILIIVVCVFAWTFYRLSYFSSRGVRTLRPVPFLGNLAAATFGKQNFVDAVDDGYRAFNSQRYFGLYQYHVPTLIPRDPELIRQIMVRDFHAFADRGVHIDAETDPLFGRNLIMLRGSKWREMRTALSPAFSAARCKNMAPLMDVCASNAAEYLRTKIGNGIELETNDGLVAPYVNDVIASCAFGFNVNTLKEPGNCIFKLGQKALVQDNVQIMKFFGHENFPTLMKLLGVKILTTSVANQYTKLFKSALESRRNMSSGSRPDFIQSLVDATQEKTKQDTQGSNNDTDTSNYKKFTDDDLASQGVLFYVAGYDTTANLINFCLYEIAMNPEVQEKLQRELDDIPVPDNVMDLYESIQSMEYLEMVFSEVLRLWPLIGNADRRSVARYDFGPTHEGTKNNLVAEAGIHVWLPIYSLHRDPEYWDNPSKCDPERFAPGNRAKIKPYTYLPFGTGPRHCIGSRFAVLTSKVLITRLLREFSIRPSPKTPTTQRVEPKAFVLRSAHGFNLIIEPRNI